MSLIFVLFACFVGLLHAEKTQYGEQPQGEWMPQNGQQPQAEWNSYFGAQNGEQPQGEWQQNGQQPQGEWNSYFGAQNGEQPQGEWQQNGQQPQGEWNSYYGEQPQGEQKPYYGEQNGEQPQGERNSHHGGQHGEQPQGEWKQQNGRGDMSQYGEQPEGEGEWNSNHGEQNGEQPQGWQQNGEGDWNDNGNFSQFDINDNNGGKQSHNHFDDFENDKMYDFFSDSNSISRKESEFKNFTDSDDYFKDMSPKIVHSEVSKDKLGRSQVIDIIETLEELNSTKVEKLTEIIAKIIESMANIQPDRLEVELAQLYGNSNWTKRATLTTTATYQATTTYVGASAALVPVAVLMIVVTFVNLFV